jgi:hypothetical protein
MKVLRISRLQLILLGMLFLSGHGFAAPTTVAITDVAYSGSGCPAQSARTIVSLDGEALTLIFDQYFAVQDQAASPQERRRKCQLEVELSYSGSWQYTITSVDYRGFASLAAGTWGQQFSRYKFKGGQPLKPARMRLEGPYLGSYFRRDERQLTTNAVWSTCAAQSHLSIETAIFVGGIAGRQAYMSIDSLDSEIQEVEQSYHLEWRPCRNPASPPGSGSTPFR